MEEVVKRHILESISVSLRRRAATFDARVVLNRSR
jgi:hypothetical protein